MSKVRRDAWTLDVDDKGWSDTTLWYAKAVTEMQKRPLAERTSWRFFAGIHDFDADMWRDFGYLDDADTDPSEEDFAEFWEKCRHGEWYFLPWHRGYLAAFEQNVRAAVVALGGPADWALPYWNYNNPDILHPRRIPLCFMQPTLPDGSPNPLCVEARYGLDADGEMMNVIDERISDRKALGEDAFEGEGQGGSAGFGGSPGGSGQVEMSPHNHIHTRIGGVDRGGLMSSTQTAGLDPIFWLHHANIDRLWEVWLNRNPEHLNPDKDEWLGGPPPPEPRFVMPDANGAAWEFAPDEMLDTQAPHLDYIYDDIRDPLGGERMIESRLLKIGVPRAAAAARSMMEVRMPRKPTVELIGANDRPLRLEGIDTQTSLEVDTRGSNKLMRSFSAKRLLGDEPHTPDRVFLNLENVRGRRDAMVLDVYLNLPSDADPQQHPELRVGSVSLFGIRKASRSDAPHGGSGLNLTVEITDYIDAQGLDPSLDLQDLRVKLIAEAPIKPEDDITIGRISLYRQGD